MRPVSPKVREAVLARKEICQRRALLHDHDCQGRLTWEHTLTYAGRQVDEAFAIVKICAWAHDVDEFQDGGNLNKEKNQLCALMQATEQDFARYPRAGWSARLAYLTGKYLGKTL